MTAPEELRSRLALSLDVDDLVVADRLARRLAPWFGVVKVGLELFAASGPEAIGTFVDAGYRVFVDLKLHDIPTTVGRAARVLGALGASMTTIHTVGGVEMVRAGVEGLAEGAAAAGLVAPMALGVTVLTSEADASPDVLAARVAVATTAGCGGLVCAASDIAVVRALAPTLTMVVPGIRMPGDPLDDQRRSAEPAAALAQGADLLVVGRSVTAAPDPAAAAERLVESVLST